MDYLVWAIPTTLWLLVSLDAATWRSPLVLLERTHKLLGQSPRCAEHELVNSGILGLRRDVDHQPRGRFRLGERPQRRPRIAMAAADQRHHCFHRHVLFRPRHFRVWLVITAAHFPHPSAAPG